MHGLDNHNDNGWLSDALGEQEYSVSGSSWDRLSTRLAALNRARARRRRRKAVAFAGITAVLISAGSLTAYWWNTSGLGKGDVYTQAETEGRSGSNHYLSDHKGLDPLNPAMYSGEPANQQIHSTDGTSLVEALPLIERKITSFEAGFAPIKQPGSEVDRMNGIPPFELGDVQPATPVSTSTKIELPTTERRFQTRFSLYSRILPVNDLSSAKNAEVQTTDDVEEYLVQMPGVNQVFSTPEFSNPIEIGLSVSQQFSRRWFVDAGASWMRINSSSRTPFYKGTQTLRESVVNQVGIHVGLQYEFIQKGRFRAYASTGLSAYKVTRVRSRYEQYVNDEVIHRSTQNDQPQGTTSFIDVAAGASYNISGNFDVYGEGSIRLQQDRLLDIDVPDISGFSISGFKLGVRYTVK